MLSRLFALAGLLFATAAHAQTRADALLSIDQNRVTVIDRIMRDTGDAVARTQGISAAPV